MQVPLFTWANFAKLQTMETKYFRYRDCQLIDNARNKKLRNIARDVLRIASGEMVDQIERRLMKWTDNYSFH